MNFPSLVASQRRADQAESHYSFGGSDEAEPAGMTGAWAEKNEGRQHFVLEQARAAHTAGTDRTDKTPHRSKGDKEPPVVLGRSAGCSGGKGLVLG